MGAERMVIQEQLPTFDVVVAEHVIVDAGPITTWQAARELDFATVHTPLIDAAFWVRGLPARVSRRLPRRLWRLRPAAGDHLPGWVVLGETPGRETALGAVGKVWKGAIEWRDVSPAQFAGFVEPGYAKVAYSFSVRPYGTGRTLLTYECRVATTDPVSRRWFAAYWWTIRPFVRHIMRAALAAIGADAARRASVTGTADPAS
jgi:hypothetical protein